jgi:NADH:ubiquinone oxidoreductase subunit 2 (subunit N)
MFIIESNDLILTFVAIELLNFSIYLLIGKYTNGIKYFLLSSIMSTILLLSITIIYATYGHTNYDVIVLLQSSSLHSPFLSGGGGMSLLMFVLFFKLGFFPFHQLTADLYDGISTNILILFQIPIKFTILILASLLNPLSSSCNNSSLLEGALLGSILIPAILLQFQYTFKRFIAMSSISYQAILFYVMFFSYGSGMWLDVYLY